MKVEKRLVNLKVEQQEIANQLANIQHPNDVMALIQARERLIGAVSLAQALVEQKKLKKKEK